MAKTLVVETLGRTTSDTKLPFPNHKPPAHPQVGTRTSLFQSAGVARLCACTTERSSPLSTTARSKPHEALSFVKDAMTPSSGKTPVGQSNDGPKPPKLLPKARIMHTTPSAHTSGTLANTPAWAKRRSATSHTEACIDGGTLPQTVPAVQVFHQVKQGLSLTLVRYGRVIATRLDRGQRLARRFGFPSRASLMADGSPD